MFTLIDYTVWLNSSSSFTFSFRLFLTCGSSLMCFGCCCLHHKFSDCFTILTFSPSSFCETSPFLLKLVSGLLWPLLTSENTMMLFFILTSVLRFDIRSYLCPIILRPLRVRLYAFHSCSLCIYIDSALCSIGLLFVVQHHPHFLALYAVSVRRLECLPPASFRFHFTVDTLAIG